MRYDLTDFEWSVIEPLLPMDRRGPKPKNNRQILNGMFYILRTGCPWRDLPERYGPYTTVYNRFNRWRKAGIWDRMMDAIVKAHDGHVQMIAARSCACINMPPVSKRVRAYLKSLHPTRRTRSRDFR